MNASPDTAHSSQQHPLGIYLKVWLLLFVLSAFSYMVDYFHVQGYLRWFLVMTFMLLKAGLIVAVFMHVQWERLALICTILLPPLCLLVLIGIMRVESDYTLAHREQYFAPPRPSTVAAPAGHHRADEP
jgi:caa(3)-type oxidase subunit IV